MLNTHESQISLSFALRSLVFQLIEVFDFFIGYNGEFEIFGKKIVKNWKLIISKIPNVILWGPLEENSGQVSTLLSAILPSPAAKISIKLTHPVPFKYLARCIHVRNINWEVLGTCIASVRLLCLTEYTCWGYINSQWCKHHRVRWEFRVVEVVDL